METLTHKLISLDHRQQEHFLKLSFFPLLAVHADSEGKPVDPNSDDQPLPPRLLPDVPVTCFAF